MGSFFLSTASLLGSLISPEAQVSGELGVSVLGPQEDCPIRAEREGAKSPWWWKDGVDWNVSFLSVLLVRPEVASDTFSIQYLGLS